MNYSILPLEKQKENRKKIEQFNKDLKFIQISEIKENNVLFIFGGDGTFLKILKEYLNKKILIILVNEGRVGFLSSLDVKDLNVVCKKINENNFNNFYYLNIKDGKNEYKAINEIMIETDHLNNFQSKVNDLNFLDFYCSKIFFINYIGSTGLARSYRYPILLREKPSYIFDVLDSPQYNYNRNLNQPIIFSKDDKFLLLNSNPLEKTIKCDNTKYILKNKEIKIEMKKTKCKILKFENRTSFISKLKKIL